MWLWSWGFSVWFCSSLYLGFSFFSFLKHDTLSITRFPFLLLRKWRIYRLGRVLCVPQFWWIWFSCIHHFIPFLFAFEKRIVREWNLLGSYVYNPWSQRLESEKTELLSQVSDLQNEQNVWLLQRSELEMTQAELVAENTQLRRDLTSKVLLTSPVP